jgi:DNA polymerase-3 subunit delta
MARASFEDFKEKLAKGKPVPAVLLLGDQPFLRDACRAQLIEKYVPEAARAWAVSRFSAERGETQAALDQAQSMPMLSKQQVVFLEDAEAIEDLGEKNRESTVEAMEEYLKNPAPFTVLVMEATKLDMRMQLGKKLAEYSMVVEVGLGENAEERNAVSVVLAKTLAKEQGVEFAKGAAEDLAEFVSGDLMRLKTEVDKLATFAAESKLVRREDVSLLVISEKTTTIWEVADLLAARQTKKALRRADGNDWRDGVDVPQTDRGERSAWRDERMAGGAGLGNASGTSGAGATVREKDFQGTFAGRVDGVARSR